MAWVQKVYRFHLILHINWYNNICTTHPLLKRPTSIVFKRFFQNKKMISKKEPSYIMPAGYRKMENMHIIFWLMKDVSWCMIWKPIGIVMIFPTLIISIIIAWRTREIRSELAHNLAITFWIVANSYWMISEFFGFDEKIFFWGIDGRHLTISTLYRRRINLIILLCFSTR